MRHTKGSGYVKARWFKSNRTWLFQISLSNWREKTQIADLTEFFSKFIFCQIGNPLRETGLGRADGQQIIHTSSSMCSVVEASAPAHFHWSNRRPPPAGSQVASNREIDAACLRFIRGIKLNTVQCQLFTQYPLNLLKYWLFAPPHLPWTIIKAVCSSPW